MRGRNVDARNAESLAVGRLEQAHMRLLEKWNKHHAGDKAANMCYISHIAADLPQIRELQHNPTAKHEKGRHIHHPEKNQNADNAANIGARMQEQISSQHTGNSTAGADHWHR